MANFFFETEGELDSLVLSYFTEVLELSPTELEEKMIFSSLEIAETIADFLLQKGLVVIGSPCEGCVGSCGQDPCPTESPVEKDIPSGQTTNQ